MEVQRLGHLRHPQGGQALRAGTEKAALPLHNDPGTPEQGALPLLGRPQHVFRLAQLFGKVPPHLFVLRLGHQLSIVLAHPEGGPLAPGAAHREAALPLLHHQVGLGVVDLLGPLKHASGAGVQLPDGAQGLLHLVHGDPQPAGDGPVAPPGQQVQVVPDDGQGGARLADARQLQFQALGQVGRPHPRRLQGFQQRQRFLQPRQGNAALAGQLLQGDAEVAVVVQAPDEVLHQPAGVLLRLQPAQLPGQEADQRLLQPAAGAHPAQGVQLLVAEPLVKPVLAVVVLQPVQAAEQLVAPLGLGGGRKLLHLHHRIFLGQLPHIGLQLHGAELEQLHA